MGLKAKIAQIFAQIISKSEKKWIENPIEFQTKIFNNLISVGTETKFGKDHHFEKIQSYEDFKKQVPIRDYEDLKPYIELIKEGKSDIIWKGKPIYFAKTSGTTSGTKYIPITKESMPSHIKSARNALLNYMLEKKQQIS